MFRHEENEIFNAILEESCLPVTMKALLKKMFQIQIETIRSLEEIVRREGWREKSVETRLDELLKKVDPEKYEKRKNAPQCEGTGSVKMPNTSLF